MNLLCDIATQGTRVSNSILPQPGGSRPPIYILHEQGGPIITQGIGFPFRRLLRHAGPRWRYSNLSPRYIASARTAQRTSLPLLRLFSLPEKERVRRAVP
jgi:hypothetical protein